MKDNKKVLYVLVVLALILSVAGIAVGFASMSQELNINGQAEVTPASWKIVFKNLSSAAIVGDAEEIAQPQLATATHISGYDVKLTKPGDSVTYTFDVVNEGSLDASLTTYTFATPTFTGTGDTAAADAAIAQANVEYTLTYYDGTAIGVNDTLDAGETKKLKLTVAYKSSADTLPTDKVEISGMDVTFVYTQS